MADRFWVGGGASANWSATANTNWSATSGGANNASVPTTTDRVIFDANSGAGNSVISANITVQSLVCTGYTGTITHNATVTLTLNTAAVDTLLFSAGMTYAPNTSTSIIALTHTTGTADITSAGQRLGALTISGVGGTTRILDNLRVDSNTSASIITLTNGTFNGNGFTVTTPLFSSNNSNVRTLQLGGGDWTVGGGVVAGATFWALGTTTNLTFTKGASNIIVPSNSLAFTRIFAGGGLAYNNLTIASNSARGVIIIQGAGNTFANLAVGAGNMIELVPGITNITNAPTWTGTAALPILVKCSTTGSSATISIASGTMTLNYGGLRDITGSGGATFVATNAYDHGNTPGWAITAPPAALTAADIRAAVGLASANLDTQLAAASTKLDTIDDFVDTEIANIQSRLPAALVGGRMDASVGAVASGVIAAASFAAGALDAVWSVSSRLLTAGTNIVLAKGTGLTGLNDLSAVQVNAEVDTAIADVGLTTTITGRIDAAITTRLASGSYTAPDNASVAAIKFKTDNLPSDPADQSLIIDATGAILTAVGDVPTNAELATALGTSDDAVLAAIADLTIPSASANAAALLAAAFEGAETVQDFLRLSRAVLYGDGVGINTSAKSFRDKANTKNRVAVTQTGGSREVTVDAA